MVASVIGLSAGEVEFRSEVACSHVSVASRMRPGERKELAVEALARAEPVSHMAQRHGVSRKFVYQQKAKASDALDEAFEPCDGEKDVLFHLPVNKRWIEQLVLALTLNCHSSLGGIVMLLEDLFDYRLCPATVHNIIRGVIAQAREINQSVDLSGVRVGAHDEIFQGPRPVLVAVDALSTYCYLLSLEEHRDGDTWGVRLLERTEQGLRPEYTVADDGKGLRAGQRAAWGDSVPCHGDVFHGERELGQLVTRLENRAIKRLGTLEAIESQMQQARAKGTGQSLSKSLALARQEALKAMDAADQVRTIADWLRDDVLALAGPDLDTRRELFDFLMEELGKLEVLCPSLIGPVHRRLQRQRDDLLGFAAVLDRKLADVAERWDVPLYLVRAVCERHGQNQRHACYWEQEAQLRQRLRWKFHPVESDVLAVMQDTPRASSMVENLNSRLRNYFFLRRSVGPEILELLQFFLNHRRFPRSRREERRGKSPTELLTGKDHAHWLELLGYKRFHRTSAPRSRAENN